ncbi:hypothetical protein FA95DRAFT_992802 [Auriscalpium vulgare]|uniref:Uncharacterized protein n=1 Tax=Auriscalpium vulgare TaxID=40419 RepID=A0ACB8R727_9AGAM|nr:hypothetical protein FA95DRAFT_992802 [Auriscalpium vulgare]
MADPSLILRNLETQPSGSSHFPAHIALKSCGGPNIATGLLSVATNSGRDIKPTWTPSFLPHQNQEKFEDGVLIYKPVMDAARIVNGVEQDVVSKSVSVRDGSEEVQTFELLTSAPLASDPRNHTPPLLTVMQVPDEPEQRLLVMPLLRLHDDPRFETFGEAIAFFTQTCEGIQCMHEHRIEHRGCTHHNIMVDPTGMYSVPFHPAKQNMRRDWKGKAKPRRTRTQLRPRYFLIDFGLSRSYPPSAGDAPMDLPIQGCDKTVPEHENEDVPCDSSAVDVYYLGNLVREEFMMRYHGFSFMRPLVEDMVATDPSKRPKMDEVVARFKEIRHSVNFWKLRSRMVSRKEWRIVGFGRSFGHWYRRLGYIVTRTAAIPDPQYRVRLSPTL